MGGLSVWHLAVLFAVLATTGAVVTGTVLLIRTLLIKLDGKE